MKNKIKILLSLIFAVIMLTGCTLLDEKIINDNATTPVLSSTEQQERIAEISREYVDVVVTVFVVRTADDKIDSFGSGVIIHQSGFIATNNHVIDKIVNDTTNKYKLKVAFNSSDNMHSATVEWYNLMLDVAIIKVDVAVSAYAPMKDRFLFVEENQMLYASETVIAIGTPIAYSYKNTVTVGTISSKQKRVSYADGNVYEHLIQHTAFINHGNSGGGLFDLNGNLIGLNTLGHNDAHGLFFAVSIYPIIEVLDDVVQAYELNQKFEIGKFGIEAVDKYQAEYFETSFDDDGLLVINVIEGGASAGILLENDIIIKIKVDSATYNVDLRNDFVYALLKTTSGTTVELSFLRDDVTHTAAIVLT